MVKNKLLKIILLFSIFISLNISKEIENINTYTLLLDANAQPNPGPCAQNGYKTWNGGLFGTKAKDCWCDTIRRPLQECSVVPN